MKLRLLPVAAALAAAAYATAPADATPRHERGHDPVTICHATGNGKYVKITVDDDATYGGHGNHAEDLIPAPEDGCPTPPPPTTAPPAPPTTPVPPDNLTPPTTAPAPIYPATPVCPFPGLGLYNFHDAECVAPKPAPAPEIHTPAVEVPEPIRKTPAFTG